MTVATLKTQLGSNSPASDPTRLPIQEQVGHPARCHADKWRCLTYANFSIGLATFPISLSLPSSLPYTILRLFLNKTFFVCQFQERFPLSVIKCSVAVINLFRSIVDGDARRSATKLKCIDIEKLIIKERRRVAKVAQRASVFGIGIFIICMVYAKFYRIVNAEIKYFRKKVSKITKSNKQKKKKKASETPRTNFKTFSLTAAPTRQRHNRHTHSHAQRLSLFAHESMLHTLRQQAKRV